LNDDPLPDWLARQLLHRVVVELELPWDATALVRGPGPGALTHNENLEAVDLSLRIVSAMRRKLPWGISGAAVDRNWLHVAFQVAAWAIVRGHAPGLDDLEPPQAVVERGPPPRGPQPGGGAVAVEIVARKGGRRVPR
jgi:hypothetical protein